jgi:hypothetical protein
LSEVVSLVYQDFECFANRKDPCLAWLLVVAELGAGPVEMNENRSLIY